MINYSDMHYCIMHQRHKKDYICDRDSYNFCFFYIFSTILQPNILLVIKMRSIIDLTSPCFNKIC